MCDTHAASLAAGTRVQDNLHLDECRYVLHAHQLQRWRLALASGLPGGGGGGGGGLLV